MAARKISLATKKSWAQDKWIGYVNEGLSNAAESIIQAGVRMYEFKTQSKCCKGGSEYGRILKDKLGMSASMSSRWATIGENSHKLLVATKDLPNSMEAVYLISTLSEEEIAEGIKNGSISHESTQKDIKHLKQIVPPAATSSKSPQDPPGPNGKEDEEWEALLEKFDGNEDIATAVWDEIISEAEGKKIQEGKVNVNRMAKKLYGDKSDPNMLPSQVADILNLDQDKVNAILNIKATSQRTPQKRKLFFEVTDDVKMLVKELENPEDVEAMKTDKARELYNQFKRIVELWSEIIEGE